MTTHEAFALAFAEIAALKFNPLAASDAGKLGLMKGDVRDILKRLQASIEAGDAQSFAIAAQGGFEQEDYLREQPE